MNFDFRDPDRGQGREKRIFRIFTGREFGRFFAFFRGVGGRGIYGTCTSPPEIENRARARANANRRATI